MEVRARISGRKGRFVERVRPAEGRAPFRAGNGRRSQGSRARDPRRGDPSGASTAGRRPGTSAAAPPKFDRRRRIAIAAAAVALILTAVALFLPATNPQRAAADEMQRLGTVAAGGPPVSVEPGSYLYTKLDIHGPQGQTMIGGPSFSLIVDEIEETWTANDGSGRRVTTVNASTFRSASDRQAWEKLGSPPIPQAGDVTTQTYRPGELGSFDVTDLPAAPHALEEAIHSGRVISEPAGEINTRRDESWSRLTTRSNQH